MKEMFKAGDRVEVINNSTIAAEIGRKATIKGYENGYVQVVWDRGGLDRYKKPFKQVDGGYRQETFVKIIEDWDT